MDPTMKQARWGRLSAWFLVNQPGPIAVRRVCRELGWTLK